MPYSNDKIKVLIVDDLSENLRALDAILRAPDRVIIQARSGLEALELLLEHDFALAMVDVEMPEMDGFQLAELMRGTEKTKHVPIVFVTAAGMELNYAFKGYGAGAVDVLYKPLDINAVKSKANVFVELFRHRTAFENQVRALEESRKEQECLLQQLQATQAELQHSLNMREEFMSLVAHEMRTPLNTLFLEVQVRLSQLAKNNLSIFTPEHLQKMLDRSERQLKSMMRLIEDMLDVSRIKNGKLSIQPQGANLSLLVRQLAEDLTPLAKESEVEFVLQIDSEIEGHWDAFRIEQIIINLLTNAVRYGKGKPVHVSLAMEGEHAVIKVADQGVGIAEHEQKKIFEAFERSGDNEVKAGLGLGLYISRKLAEAHAGEISVVSQKNHGSTFILRLPLKSVAA
ncbi:hybrid sensor histidine kinase/response regulator [Methylophilus luteus]|uniref:histidine kinase n=1 Tax=Methylophilus luteus TaxID=640108 RepID=A0ABW3FCF7_9PROT